MKTFLVLFLFMVFLTDRSFSQKIRVVDSKGERLPFFSLRSPDSNLVKVGNESGEMDLSGIEMPLCGIEIRYLGFEPLAFCDSILVDDEVTLIKLKESFLELSPVDVKTADEKRVFENFRFLLKNDLNNFTMLKGQYLELIGKTEFHSFGILAYSGLIDRNQKANKFSAGNIAYFHQKQLLANFDPNEIPYQTSFAILSQFLNDLFFGIIQSHKNEYQPLESKVVSNTNIITYSDKNRTIQTNISEHGVIQKISINNTSFISANGIPIKINRAEVHFFENRGRSYIAKINLLMNVKNREVKINYLTHGFPYDIQIPDRLSEEKEKMAFFTAALAHSSSPDYSFQKSFFSNNEILEYVKMISFNSRSTTNLNLLNQAYDQPYLYYEKMNQSDQSSTAYMKKISEFVNSLNLTFQNNDLGW
ncbi:hypothetical protein [Cognataquiflexum rubidum]|uniref:hypothetical protein n=1 Tax=Cognataquiflexum rubidum TaxID=2922273 RepID=UPI001F13A0FA|nr:hypothetical protein [Cognataquiflexum rubidum]MCH6232600.1 hypothetical protein [Cognataquiflexum rubidum]